MSRVLWRDGAWLRAAFVACPLLCFALGLAAPAEAAKRALLIGIDEYQALPNLRGAVNDVDLLERVLLTKAGFRPEHILRMTDAEATREGILSAFRQLVSAVEPGDLLFVHYSGLGSQVNDLNGDEIEDGMDETLVPHDGRTQGVADIVDDELASLLEAIGKDVQLVVVLDASHSGRATRGDTTVLARSVEVDERSDLYHEGIPASLEEIPMLEEHHLLIAAAPSDQSTLEGPVDGRAHGLFTFALARALSAADPKASAREVLRLAERELARIKVPLSLAGLPEPQLEGPAARLEEPLLENARLGSRRPETPRRPFASLEAQPGSERVVMRNATALGAQVGSVWAVHAPDSLAFPPGTALAEAVVSERRGDDALATIRPADAPLPSDTRAVLVTPSGAPGGATLRSLGPPSARANALRAALRSRLPGSEWVSAGAFAHLVVDEGDGAWRVYAADGHSLIRSLPWKDAAATSRELTSLLGRALASAELSSLDHPASAMRLDLAVTRRGERGLAILPAGAGSPRYRIRQRGEPRSFDNSLQLQVSSSHDCFLTLVHVDPQGALQVLFPNGISESRGFLSEGRLAPGQAALIPDALTENNRAGFHMDYAAPAGIDTIRAFCTTGRSNANDLRAQIRKVEALGSTSLEQRLAGLAALRRQMASAATLGGSDWSAVSATIEVLADPPRTRSRE